MGKKRSVPELLWVVVAAVVCAGGMELHAQPASREQYLETLRAERLKNLWPERQSIIPIRLNQLFERGLLEGTRTGKGASGPQILLGGMRNGQGFAAGVGYRRSDLLRDMLDLRVSARGSVRLGYMFSGSADIQRLHTDKGFLSINAKYENAPRIDYYGSGPQAARANRSSYRLEETRLTMEAGRTLRKNLKAGLIGGLYAYNAARGHRPGFPSTEEIFTADQAPGLDRQTWYTGGGGFLQYDSRDNPGGPRSGGNYYSRYTFLSDRRFSSYSHHLLDSAAERYFAYANQTRVIAVRVGTMMTFTGEGHQVPFYLQPHLGGNRFLRGFAWYRFHDRNTAVATVEHRWHVFAGMDAALFFETGKVAPKVTQLNFQGLEYSGGLGLRFKLRDSVFMRIDQAVSREGYRLIWTFSDLW